MSYTIVAIGEVLWDLLPVGPQLGGAPANFACLAKSLGADARMITRVGADDFGRRAIAQLAERGLPIELIEIDPAAPTGTVSVDFDPSGAHTFIIHEHVAWDRLTVTPAGLAAVGQADAICFGALAQRSPTSRAACQELVAASNASSLRIFDINLRQKFYSREVIAASLELANVLKVNDDELPVLAALFGLAGGAREQLATLADRFALKLVALTRGKHGSLLCSQGAFAEHPGVEAAPFKDSIGAGDAFTAALTLGMLHGWRLEQINLRANQVAAEVCQHAGAMAAISEGLRGRF
jgi:fructokinase